MGVIVDARAYCADFERGIKDELSALGELCLASVAFGDNPSMSVYRSSQNKIAQRFGVRYLAVDLPYDCSFESLSEKMIELNRDPSVNGIILNKPFPEGLKEEEVFSFLDPKKDLEGVHPENISLFFSSGQGEVLRGTKSGRPFTGAVFSPTAKSVLCLLGLCGASSVRGKRVLIVGFSSIVGKPLSFILAASLATVSIANIATYENGDLPFYVKEADIVISACGVPELIKGEWIKPGAVVIDVGTGYKQGKLTGDIEFSQALNKASYITEVPGGVGALTPLFLFDNLAIAARRELSGRG